MPNKQAVTKIIYAPSHTYRHLFLNSQSCTIAAMQQQLIDGYYDADQIHQVALSTIRNPRLATWYGGPIHFLPQRGPKAIRITILHAGAAFADGIHWREQFEPMTHRPKHIAREDYPSP